jgi:hypothetical protein
MEVKEQNQVKILKRFVQALENLGGGGDYHYYDYDDVNINQAWETIRENTNALATESQGY